MLQRVVAKLGEEFLHDITLPQDLLFLKAVAKA
jgi:hypothetical protein